ncbi:hypothetical protein HPB49_008918 [Dermacentor silvarum]|uniref:Uncharacterized protein n=1 Tax=Dermacentor silvarum TaxID=543639 RepID=A0ACB8C8J7_DERSI|nr:hypothetical protein HPB49_008918 [Dermacentor silvarum]
MALPVRVFGRPRLIANVAMLSRGTIGGSFMAGKQAKKMLFQMRPRWPGSGEQSGRARQRKKGPFSAFSCDCVFGVSVAPVVRRAVAIHGTDAVQECLLTHLELIQAPRQKTSLCGRRVVHPEPEDKVANFVGEHRARSWAVTAELILIKAIELAHESGLTRRAIGNADETPVWFDVPSSTTVCERGAKEVKLLLMGNEHSGFTVMLICTADERGIPAGCYSRERRRLYRQGPRGQMDPNGLESAARMLVLDAFRGHLNAGVKQALRDERTELAVIPGGMTSTLQPLDVVLNKPFKDLVRDQWMAGDSPKTPTGWLHRLPRATVAAGVSQAWCSLHDDMVVWAFKKCCIGNSLDGTEDDLWWDAASEKQMSSD